LVNPAFTQQLAQPKLIGTWRPGYEDYNEFIYHRVEWFAAYLKDNPRLQMVARLCSRDKLPLALASSSGFAFTFPEYGKQFHVPTDSMSFARWSKCERRSEQYWLVPENSRFAYDELVSADRVKVNRWYVGSSSNRPEEEFARNVNELIAELKSNAQAEGFIIRTVGMRSRNLTKALARLRNEKVDRKRFRILRKQVYVSPYPEFLTISISD
jgi:hypothetical protein